MAEIIDRLRGILSDRYTIERELGRGGMATVYLASDVRHDREVAIKVLHPDLSATIGNERFEREIKLAAKLQHPHILGLYDSGAADGLLFYVMPFVKGESVRDRLDREKQLPIEDAIQIILEVADALGYAHAQGIIHRDIKPENIMLSNGHALVADFGIARARTEAGQQKLTQTGMAVGTPVYMSPEQSSGDAVGPQADIYSLGCVLYEMLAGEPPFTGPNAMVIMARHAMETVPSIRIVRPSVPEEVEEAILASMEKAPVDRPKTAADFTNLLGTPLGATATRRAAMRYTGTRRVPTGAVPVLPLPVPVWKKPWAIGVAALVVVAGSLGVWKLSGAGGRRSGLSSDPMSKQVAMLYLADDGKDLELRGVADRITESVIRDLQKIPSITVVSRDGVAPFRNADVSRDSIAKSLKAGTLVSGTIESAGANRVAVSIRLYDGVAGTDLDRRGLSIARDSLFSAESAVAGKVAEMLKDLLGNEIALRETQAGTRSKDAFSAYSRAEKVRKDALAVAARSADSARAFIASADALALRAEQADGKWIEPQILRGELALQLARLGATPDAQSVLLDTALVRAAHALATDPSSARAQALQGSIELGKARDRTITDPRRTAAFLDSAEKHLLGATTQDPSLASAFATLSNVYYDKKDVPSAYTFARRAYEADYFLANREFILLRLFWTSHDQQNMTEARARCAEGAQRFPNNWNFVECRLWLMLHPEAQRNIDSAWAIAARVAELAPANGRPPQAKLARMIVAGIIGIAAKTNGNAALLDSANRVLLANKGTPSDDPSQELLGYEAVMRAQFGDKAGAIRLLKPYVAANPTHSFRVGGNVNWWWANLVNEAAFKSLLSRGG